jgi:Putative Flp pilus-assembly TadE/G-like
MTKSATAIKTLTAFSADSRGTTAILFALLAVPIFCMALVGLDLSRAEGVKSAITSAADSAAKAGAKMLGAPHDQVEGVVRAFLSANLPPDKKDLPYVLTFAADDTALTIKIDTSVKTSMFAIAGIKKLDIAVESTGKRPELAQILQPAHRGIDPDIAYRPALNRAPNAREMREAEAEVRAMLEELKRSGGSPDVDRLLRVLGNSR